MRRNVLLLIAVVLGGCVSASYTLIPAGVVPVGELQLQPTTAWNLAPRIATPLAREASQNWTLDGLSLNNLMVIPDVPNGEPLFMAPNKTMALPAFRADMLANELVELIESSVEKIFGEGGTEIESDNLRPHRFGTDMGILFDLRLSLSDGPRYRGTVGAFIANQHLYMVLFIGAEPYYFEKDREAAERIIRGARLT
jgi:hypothetical protein